MVVVDTSVLIDWLRNTPSSASDHLARIAGRRPIILGDLVLMEVLQGARNERDAQLLRRRLHVFEPAEMVDHDAAEVAAMYYRKLRGLGITVTKPVDLLIGTFCIVHGHELLHSDRDFESMERHLGLRVAGGPEPVH